MAPSSSAVKSRAGDELVSHFVRDLCTKTAEEIKASWTPDERRALDKVKPGAFRQQLRNHNPIYFLAKRVWFNNDTGMLYPPLHRDRLCTALLDYYLTEDKTVSGLLILIQRDSFKSTFMHGVFPQFVALREKYVNGRDARILLLHHKEDQASFNLQRLKAKSVHSDFMHKYWGKPPYVFASPDDFGTKTKFDWPSKTQGVFHEPSVMAAGLGARLTGFHFDWSMNDDLVTEEHRQSKAVRDDAFFKYQASRFMLDTSRGKEVDSGTRYHLHDLWAKLRASVSPRTGEPLYQQLIVGAGGTRAGGALTFPTRHTEIFLEQKRDEEMARSGNDILWWLQYQNDAKSERLVAADPAWVNFIEPSKIPLTANRAIIVDPAWKGTKNAGTGDDAAIAVVAFDRRGFMVLTYLLDLVVSDMMTSLDGVNCIFNLMRKWGVVDVAVEEHGGHTFRTDLENEAVSRGRHINLVDLKSKQTAKQERITTFLRRAQSGQFFITTDCPNRDVFMSQFEDFPQLEKDDALDCVSYSADINMVERFGVPNWNEEQGYQDGWVPHDSMQYHRRTRHTTV